MRARPWGSHETADVRPSEFSTSLNISKSLAGNRTSTGRYLLTLFGEEKGVDADDMPEKGVAGILRGKAKLS